MTKQASSIWLELPSTALSKEEAETLALYLQGKDEEGWTYGARHEAEGKWFVEVRDEQGIRMGDL